jgi:hypothetical protein
MKLRLEIILMKTVFGFETTINFATIQDYKGRVSGFRLHKFQ